jgi:hypothetical protein
MNLNIFIEYYSIKTQKLSNLDNKLKKTINGIK